MNTDAMKLYQGDLLIGTLTRYEYATPWASAWLIAYDPVVITRYAAIDAFLQWCNTIPTDLTDREADIWYDQELAARGLDEATVQSFWAGWRVWMPDGIIREIGLVGFEDDGFLTWRW